ncbi:MAG: cyclic nucleotide-binding domain-containing protein [Treponema sp.]|nr:cyclic nucleotide-binding domain-containing protein [Treponema sp.]
MILTVLIRFLHASPDTVTKLMDINPMFENFFSIESVINVIEGVKSIGRFEIVIVFFIFWMARNFSNSIMNALHHIFHERVTPRPVLKQLLGFAGEFIIVLVFVLLLLLFYITETIQAVFWLKFPRLPTSMFTSIFAFFFLFILSFIAYKGGTRSKPAVSLAFISSLLFSISFFLIRKFMSCFININKYNLVYGLFSQLIVNLLAIYIFFTFFLFFAQFIFVVQFFDDLLLGEIYLLPENNYSWKIRNIKRWLFLRPDFFIRCKTGEIEYVKYKKGEVIYKTGEEAECSYYIVSGKVSLNNGSKGLLKDSFELEAGNFFGELSCTIEKPRDNTVIAESDLTLIKVSKITFLNLLERNNIVANIVLGKIRSYFTEVYGLIQPYLL